MCVQPGVSQWHSRYTHSCVTTRWLNLQLLLEYMVDDAKKKKNFMSNVFQVIGRKFRAVLFLPESEQSIKPFIHQQKWEWKVFVMGNRCCHSLLSVL